MVGLVRASKTEVLNITPSSKLEVSPTMLLGSGGGCPRQPLSSFLARWSYLFVRLTTGSMLSHSTLFVISVWRVQSSLTWYVYGADTLKDLTGHGLALTPADP